MEFKHFSPEEMETLDQYAIALVLGMVSLKSLTGFHQKALDLGVLKEDEECRLNTIVWDIGRLNRLYLMQAESLLERLPDTLNIDSILTSLKAKELPRKRRKKVSHEKE